MSVTRDVDIRTALIDWLRRRHRRDVDVLIRHELGLDEGRRRADVAVIERELSGFEIKSDQDNLLRLSAQEEVYSKIFDRSWLVTTQRHLEKSVVKVPRWWGVVLASPPSVGAASSGWADDGLVGVHLSVVRPALRNHDVDAGSLVRLLWRDEALLELKKRNLARGMSKRARAFVWEKLAQEVPLVELRRVVRDALRARTDWGSKTAANIG